MRIKGRLLLPATLAQRRFLLGTLGVEALRVPRSQNAFAVARRLRRLVERCDDVTFFKNLVRRAKKNVPLVPSPDVDMPEPAEDAELVAAAE